MNIFCCMCHLNPIMCPSRWRGTWRPTIEPCFFLLLQACCYYFPHEIPFTHMSKQNTTLELFLSMAISGSLLLCPLSRSAVDKEAGLTILKRYLNDLWFHPLLRFTKKRHGIQLACTKIKLLGSLLKGTKIGDSAYARRLIQLPKT